MGPHFQFGVAAPANRHHGLPASFGDLRHLAPARIVDVDHRDAIFVKNTREQAGLGGEILFKISVIIQMVLAEVRKAAAARLTPSSRRWARPWDEASIAPWVTPAFGRLGENPVQCNRLGRGVRQGRGEKALDPGGPDVDR